MKTTVDINDIKAAAEKLQDVIITTQCAHSRLASQRLGAEVFLKMENEQRTGSFKLRGAYNKISSLTKEQKAKGVIACSAGNHAQGVAFSSQALGIQCTVVMPNNASLVKIAHTQNYGAKVIQHGDYFDDAAEMARTLKSEHGYEFIPPFEDPLIIAGQGTLGLELTEQAPNLDQVIIPIGGGGLISGVATAIKAINPKCQVIGVQSDQAPSMERLFHKQDPQLKSPMSTIADGIAVKKPSQYVYDNFISRLVDDVVLVSDNEIAEAIVYIMEISRSIVEGSGAAGLAAALAGKVKLKGNVAVVLSGGNIDLNIISKVIDKGLQLKGRLARLSVVVPDSPGSLSRLTQIIADQKANVLEVHHDRVTHGVHLRETRINFLIETTSFDHIEKLRSALKTSGARLIND